MLRSSANGKVTVIDPAYVDVQESPRTAPHYVCATIVRNMGGATNLELFSSELHPVRPP